MFRVGELVQQVRALAVLVEDLSLMPSTHIRWLATICNSSLRRFPKGLVVSPGTESLTLVCACTHTQTHTLL